MLEIELTRFGYFKFVFRHHSYEFPFCSVSFHAIFENFHFFPDIVATNGDWSTEDTIWFSERVVNSQFVTKILDVIYDPLDDNVRISVSLIDTTHPTTDIYIEKQLVEDKRAVYLCV